MTQKTRFAAMSLLGARAAAWLLGGLLAASAGAQTLLAAYQQARDADPKYRGAVYQAQATGTLRDQAFIVKVRVPTVDALEPLSARSSLMATSRSSRGSNASQTTDCAPCPNIRRNSNLPSVVDCSTRFRLVGNYLTVASGEKSTIRLL